MNKIVRCPCCDCPFDPPQMDGEDVAVLSCPWCNPSTGPKCARALEILEEMERAK